MRLTALLTSFSYLTFTLFPPSLAAAFAPTASSPSTVAAAQANYVHLRTAGTTKFLGQSVEIAPDGTITKYLFAGGERLAAIETPPGQLARAPIEASSTLWARAWRVLTSLIAWIIPEAEAAIAPSAMKFYHPDHLGSTNLVTDGSGAVIEVTENTPFGSIARHGGPANVPYKFTGQLQDTTNGLLLFPARAYDPQLGRFTQPDTFVQDPSDPQTLNRYSYVRDNPVNLADPTGHFFQFLIALLVAAFIGASVSVTVGAITGQIHSFGDFGRFAASGAVFGASVFTGAAFVTVAFGAAAASSVLGELGVLSAAGALSGGTQSSLDGGSFGQGALVGAATSAVTFGAGKAFSPLFSQIADRVAQTPLGQQVGETIGTYTAAVTSAVNRQLERALAGVSGNEILSRVLPANREVFRRFVTQEELESIQATGVITPGKSGTTYFTDLSTRFESVARKRLSLFEEKDYEITFRLKRSLRVTGPQRVTPNGIGGLGGGNEFLSDDPLDIILIKQPRRLIKGR